MAGKRGMPTTSSDLMSKLVKEVTGTRLNSASSNRLENGQSGSNNGLAADAPIFYTPTPSDKYKCVACDQVLRRPVKFETCGHSCCSTCFSDLMS